MNIDGVMFGSKKKTKKGRLKKKPFQPPKKVIAGKAIPSLTRQRAMYPKGVPKSFLLQSGYQFPRTTINYTWTKPELQAASSSNQVEPATVVSHDESQDTSRDVYSPSDIYDDNMVNLSDDELPDPGMSTDLNMNASGKQTNVFERLGPLQEQPKVPKITINLNLDKTCGDRTDRKVVVEKIEDSKKYMPVELREDILASVDPIVKEHLDSWAWSKVVTEKKTVDRRSFMSLSHREQDLLQESYDNPDAFVKVSVTGYPTAWEKEDVLDAIIESVRGKTFIPCFIQLSRRECKFLVLQSRQALTTLHNYGFNIRKDNVDLEITISNTSLTLKKLNFVPKLILRKIAAAGYDGERKLSLKAFTYNKDVSHFIYYPLNRISNQTQLMNFAGNIAWEYLVELDLSHNRLKSIAGFDLIETTPKLRHLDLSHNLFERLSALVCCRNIALDSINLEGNPVCNDYTDPFHYVEVIKTLYPTVKSIDGVSIQMKGEFPPFKRNYCSEEEKSVVEMVLEVYFPLLEGSRDQRPRIQHLYDDDAVMTVTCRNKLRIAHMYRNFQDLFLRARSLEEGRVDAVVGGATITKHINKWPEMEYDPTTFTIDVVYHSDTTSVIRITGLLKLIVATLAEDEHLLAFTKTFVLKTTDRVEYKIVNQMVYWDEPTKEYANNGFKLATISRKNLSLKLDTVPDEDLKEKLIKIFMKLSKMDRTISEKCLAAKNWHFKNALEHFVKFLKLDALNDL